MKPLLLLVLLLLPLACTDEAAAAREVALAESTAALEGGDPDGALVTAKRALKAHGDEPRLLLNGARAALALDRLGEAADLAGRGRALAAEDDAALRGDLAWVVGKARAGLFREVGDVRDWRQANLSLREASRAGSQRDEAALLFVLIQDLTDEGRQDRQLEVARELLGRAPDSDAARKARTYLQGKGLDP